jgi:hypothetical protein
MTDQDRTRLPNCIPVTNIKGWSIRYGDLLCRLNCPPQPESMPSCSKEQCQAATDTTCLDLQIVNKQPLLQIVSRVESE